MLKHLQLSSNHYKPQLKAAPRQNETVSCSIEAMVRARTLEFSLQPRRRLHNRARGPYESHSPETPNVKFCSEPLAQDPSRELYQLYAITVDLVSPARSMLRR